VIRFGTVRLRPARVLHVDPPWKFKDALPGKTRGAARRYPCMSVDALCAIELPPLADDCLLLLWRVAAMQREALDLMDAWGFALKSEIVWRKLTRTGERVHFGMGRYVRASHEVCLVGVRGRVRVRTRSERSIFDARVGRHSEKPAEIFAIARKLSRGPYTELFGRAPRTGWQVLGNDPALLWDASTQSRTHAIAAA
jgi:N6-adenosine-specific RNA methylase IME4